MAWGSRAWQPDGMKIGRTWVSDFLDRAELRVHGTAFNEESFARRAAAEEHHGHVMVYETNIPDSGDVHAFSSKVVPKLQALLRDKGFDPRGAPGLMVWVWHCDHAHLYPGSAFFSAVEAERRATPVMLPAP